MSKKFSIALITGIAASTITGCGLFGGGEPPVAENNPPPLPTEGTAPAPEDPLVAAAVPASPASILANLVPPTNPQTRVNDITSAVGRSDPFATTQSPIVRPPDGMTGPGTPGTPGTGPGAPGGGTSGTGPGTPSLPTVITPPAPPQPTQAEAVRLFGVAAVLGQYQAIVQAPDEPVTRTVQAGDILANNVRVVNIVALGSTPAIVLEQYGQLVEVSSDGVRRLGQAQMASGGSRSSVSALW